MDVGGLGFRGLGFRVTVGGKGVKSSGFRVWGSSHRGFNGDIGDTGL